MFDGIHTLFSYLSLCTIANNYLAEVHCSEMCAAVLIRLTWVFGKVTRAFKVITRNPRNVKQIWQITRGAAGWHAQIYISHLAGLVCQRSAVSRTPDQERCHLFAVAAFLRQTMRMQMNAGCKWNAIGLCIFHMHISASASALSKLNYKNFCHSISNSLSSSQSIWIFKFD